MNINDFSVEIRRTEKGKMRGNASILYLNPDKDGFRIRGFKILIGNYSTGFEDKEGNLLWVASPSYEDPVTGKINNIFFMPENLWRQLQAKILTEFLK